MAFKESGLAKVLHRIWTIFVPIFAVIWTVAQIINWNHNVETSGSSLFAFFMVFMGVLVMGFYILWWLNIDPVRVVYDGIMWVVNKIRKK